MAELAKLVRSKTVLHTFLAGAFLLSFSRHLWVTIWLQRDQIPGDFALIWVAGLSAHRGLNLYNPALGRQLALEGIGEIRSGWYTTVQLSYAHPPSEVLGPWVLAFLPWPIARVMCWVILHLTYLTVIGWLVWLIRRQGASSATSWTFATLAMLYTPAQFSIEVGQWDIPLLALMLAGLELAQQKRSIWMGVAVGLAATIKPTPAILLGLFLVRRDWRAIGAAIVTVLMVIGASISLVGVDDWQVWLSQILPELLRGSTFINNQTFNGLGYHLFAEAPLLFSQESPPQILGARILTTILSLITLIGTLGLAWRFARNGKEWRLQLVYALFVIAMLVSSSISWIYYYTWALLPLALLLLPQAGIFRSRKDWPWALLYIVAYLSVMAPSRFYIFAPEAYEANWFLRLLIPIRVYGAITLGALLIRAIRLAPREQVA